MMYERFSIYVSPKTLIKLRDLLAKERPRWMADTHENGELLCLWGELESRVQHLPNGIEKSKEEDWLA